MSQLFFRMLGPFEVSDGDRKISLPRSKKARAILAYLAAKRREQRKDHLVDLFFAEIRDPKGGLRWAVSRLRAALGKEVLRTDANTVALASTQFRTDIDRLNEPFTSDIHDLDNLERCIVGEFLSDLSITRIPEYEAWRLARQVDCNNHHAALLKEIARKSRGTRKAVESARKLVGLDVTRESSWALMIKSLLSMDQLSDARHFHRLAVEQLERDGVRLNGKLERVWRSRRSSDKTDEDGTTNNNGLELGLRPRIAVLRCRPGEHHASALAAAVTHTVFRACSVSKTITTLAPSTAMRTDIGGGLRTDMLLQSELVLRNGERHVEVELVDNATRECLFQWSRSFPRIGDDELAEAVGAYLAARMEIDLPIALISRVRDKPTDQLTARELYLLALPRMFSADGFDPIGAFNLLESALRRQPHFGQACCALSLMRMFMPQFNDDDEQLEISLSLARRSVEICQDDAFVLGVAGVTIGHIAKDTDTAIDLVNRAISINPYSVMARISASMVNHYRGYDEICLEYIDSVEANGDTEPVSFYCHTSRSMALYQLGDYEQALNWSRKAVGHNPKFIIALRYMLASLGQMGRYDEARQLADKLVAMDPTENVAFFRRRSAYDDESRAEHLCEGLRKAGLPESA